MIVQESPDNSGRDSPLVEHPNTKKSKQTRNEAEQVVHYTKSGIPFVYDLEDQDTGTEACVSTTYQNPAFHSSAHPSIDWSIS